METIKIKYHSDAIDKLTYIDAAKAINEDNVKECMYAGAHLNSKGMKILSDLVSQIINEREK